MSSPLRRGGNMPSPGILRNPLYGGTMEGAGRAEWPAHRQSNTDRRFLPAPSEHLGVQWPADLVDENTTSLPTSSFPGSSSAEPPRSAVESTGLNESLEPMDDATTASLMSTGLTRGDHRKDIPWTRPQVLACLVFIGALATVLLVKASFGRLSEEESGERRYQSPPPPELKLPYKPPLPDNSGSEVSFGRRPYRGSANHSQSANRTTEGPRWPIYLPGDIKSQNLTDIGTGTNQTARPRPETIVWTEETFSNRTGETESGITTSAQESTGGSANTAESSSGIENTFESTNGSANIVESTSGSGNAAESTTGSANILESTSGSKNVAESTAIGSASTEVEASLAVSAAESTSDSESESKASSGAPAESEASASMSPEEAKADKEDTAKSTASSDESIEPDSDQGKRRNLAEGRQDPSASSTRITATSTAVSATVGVAESTGRSAASKGTASQVTGTNVSTGNQSRERINLREELRDRSTKTTNGTTSPWPETAAWTEAPSRNSSGDTKKEDATSAEQSTSGTESTVVSTAVRDASSKVEVSLSTAAAGSTSGNESESTASNDALPGIRAADEYQLRNRSNLVEPDQDTQGSSDVGAIKIQPSTAPSATPQDRVPTAELQSKFTYELSKTAKAQTSSVDTTFAPVFNETVHWTDVPGNTTV